jgi:hypothetical protein
MQQYRAGWQLERACTMGSIGIFLDWVVLTWTQILLRVSFFATNLSAERQVHDYLIIDVVAQMKNKISLFFHLFILRHFILP